MTPEKESWQTRFRDKFQQNYIEHISAVTLRNQAEFFISQERQQLIQEAVECVPAERELPKSKCVNAENHLFGSCFECEKIKGWNACREEMLSKLNKLK